MSRIGIDVTSAITQGGGIGRYTRELMQALAKEDPAGLHYLFFSAKPPAKLPVPHPLPKAEHITYKAVPIDEKWLYRLWYRLRAPLPIQTFMGKLDLFHSPDFVLPPVRGNIPTILTVHDLSFVHYPEAYTDALVNYLNRVVPWSVERATHILADSQATKDDLMTLWHVPADKITVLYSGVNKQFKPITNKTLRTAVRHKYGVLNEPYIFTVGTIQPRKNYKNLIRAFRPIAENFPHNLVIAGGKGWLYEDVLQEVKTQGLTERVKFIGFVDDADLPTLYSTADLFVFPSLYEGFGLPLLEAMACGVPIISSNVSSLPEVASATTKLLPPNDTHAWTTTMSSLLDNKNERDALVTAGIAHAKTFSWATAAKQLVSIYQELLNHGESR